MFVRKRLWFMFIFKELCAEIVHDRVPFQKISGRLTQMGDPPIGKEQKPSYQIVFRFTLFTAAAT